MFLIPSVGFVPWVLEMVSVSMFNPDLGPGRGIVYLEKFELFAVLCSRGRWLLRPQPGTTKVHPNKLSPTESALNTPAAQRRSTRYAPPAVRADPGGYVRGPSTD
jgi:hypothetical protein